MHIHRPLQHHIAELTAAARALRLWVVELVAWWVMTFGDRQARIALQHDVIEARRETRELVFMAMVARMTFQKRKRGWMRPPSARRGFRYAFRSLRVQRIYTRGLRLKTLKDIRRVLGDLDRIVARAIARVPKHVATGRLVAVAPPVDGFSLAAPAPATESADTS
jgi:hypothetical protein